MCALCVLNHTGGLLTMAYHKDLLSMGAEVHHWERLRMPVPYIAMEINAQREKYRVLRDNILTVCAPCLSVNEYQKNVSPRERRSVFMLFFL
jgi:hypothetical protein